MNTPTDIGWKQFLITLIEHIRWPVAWVIIFILLREPISNFIDAVASAISS